MNPRSNHSELPGTIVTASPTQPPVQDSAVTSIQPLSFSVWPTSTASSYRCESNPVSQHRCQQLEQSKADKGVERGGQVSRHPAKAAAEACRDHAHGRGLEEVEQPKQNEGAGLP